MATPTGQKLNVQLSATWGDSLGGEEKFVDFSEATSTTGNARARISKKYAAAAANQSVDLSQFVTTATWIAVVDRGGTGINFALDNTGTKLEVAANGVAMYKNANATPPTLYLTNPNADNAAYVDIIVLGAQS